MINGIPALVSNRGGLPETVEEGGFVIPVPDDVTEQTRGLQRLRSSGRGSTRFVACGMTRAPMRGPGLPLGRLLTGRYSEPSQKARYADLIDRIGRRVPLG